MSIVQCQVCHQLPRDLLSIGLHGADEFDMRHHRWWQAYCCWADKWQNGFSPFLGILFTTANIEFQCFWIGWRLFHFTHLTNDPLFSQVPLLWIVRGDSLLLLPEHSLAVRDAWLVRREQCWVICIPRAEWPSSCLSHCHFFWVFWLCLWSWFTASVTDFTLQNG